MWQEISIPAPLNQRLLIVMKYACEAQIGIWDGKTWRDDDYDGFDLDNVTHWMPLPEIPSVQTSALSI